MARLAEPLDAIARASQIRTRQVVLTPGWWKRDGGPLLAYIGDEHRPVALLATSAKRYELFDPTFNTRTRVTAQLAATLAPIAYTFYRPLPILAQRWRHLIAFGLRGRRRDLLLALLTGLAATLLSMLTPQATAVLIDQAIPDANRSLALQLGLALAAAALGQTLFQLSQGFALMRQQVGSIYNIQPAMWDRLLKLKPAFFRRYASGDLRMRMGAINTIHNKLSGATLRATLSSVLSLLNFALMLYYSFTLALIALVVALLAISITTYVSILTLRHLRPLQALMGELSGWVVQLIQGVSKLRVAGAEERAFARWGQQYSRQQGLQFRIQRLEDWISVFNAILPTIAAATLLGYGEALVQSDATGVDTPLSTGVFLAFHVAFGAFISGAMTLSSTIIGSLDIAILWERAKPILESDPEISSDKADPGRLTGKLSLEHIMFQYQDNGPVILDDVSLHVEPGAFIALVGPSGSGKSTILRLLLGFENPRSGAVFYDDQELSQLDISAVRRQMGTVLQQTRMMAGSLFDNIAGGVHIRLDEAWEAARAVGLDADIEAMPMGMHTVVSEGGGNLSGGQRQRLLIARALVFKPAILLFDEATSALDNRSQAIVTDSLDRLPTTRIVIAHRLSTIRNADRIYVLDQGKIAQQGRFDELAQEAGLFADLMARQMI